MIQLNTAQFLLGAAKFSQLPADTGTEVAFAGRSNAGKSSALNTVTGQSKLARTSKTPGRTQEINVFTLTDTQRLIDLPGYGFAKVSQSQQQRWQATLTEYLETRQSLRGLVLLVDSRLPLKDLDLVMINWAIEAELPCHIVLTKADKLNQKERAASQKRIKEQYQSHACVSYQFFSAIKKTGLPELKTKIIDWLNQPQGEINA